MKYIFIHYFEKLKINATKTTVILKLLAKILWHLDCENCNTRRLKVSTTYPQHKWVSTMFQGCILTRVADLGLIESNRQITRRFLIFIYFGRSSMLTSGKPLSFNSWILKWLSFWPHIFMYVFSFLISII